MTRFRSALYLGAAVAAAWPALANAQSAAIEEVVVTAQKRAQPLIDVPMAITAITGETIAQKGISSMEDLSLAVPGMATREDGPGSYTIFLRGLSNQYGNDALVGVYLDEAPMSLSGFNQLDVRPFDLNRVEVLKGPQGTLYGQGSVAGTVRYITNDPDLDKFGGNAEASGAFVDGGDFKTTATGVVNIPLIPGTLAARLAGTIERGGGWQDQPAAHIKNGNDQNLSAFRGKILWQPIDNLKIQAMVDIHRMDTELGLGYENPDRTVPVAVDPARKLVPKELYYNLYNLDVNYDLGFATLTSASTYIHYRHQYPFSYVGGPETIYGGLLEGTDDRLAHAHQFSQELRLVSQDGGPFHWTVGAFYRNYNYDFSDLYDTLYAGYYYPNLTYYSANSSHSYSVFGDISYNLTDRIEIGAGARYFHDRQGSFLGVSESGTFHSLDPRVYVRYAITDNVKAYASVSKGFRSGGFNGFGLPTYKPENLINYEVGVKGAVLDQRLNFDLSAYYSDYSDMLRRGLVFLPSLGTTTQLTSNIGKARIEGVEGSLAYQVTDQLTVNGTFSYISADVTEVNAADATNIVGDLLDYVPKFAFTLGAVYNFDWSKEVPGYVRVDYIDRDRVPYTDRTSFPASNVPQWSNHISLVNARIGATIGERTTVELFGTNILNQNAYIDPYAAWENANRTHPRTIGIKIGYDFD